MKQSGGLRLKQMWGSLSQYSFLRPLLPGSWKAGERPRIRRMDLPIFVRIRHSGPLGRCGEALSWDSLGMQQEEKFGIVRRPRQSVVRDLIRW